jgi:acyl carrier protein
VLFRRRAAVAEQGPEARGHGPEVDFRKVAGSPGQSGSIPAAASGTEGRRSWSSYANDPAQGMFARERVPQLRRFLSERLPEYMMPSAFVLLSGLPLTPNGKVDRGALPAPGPTDLELGRTYVAPRTPAEERMAEIWAAVLGLARVGIHDSFFELGGHSLMATQLVSRVRDAFQVAMPLRQLFETPTIAGLLAAVTERPPGLPDPPIAEIRRTEGEEEQQLLANVEHLSDAEVDALLRELLTEPE